MNKNTIEFELDVQQENLRVLQEALKNINTVIQDNESIDNSRKIVELLKEGKENLDLVRANIESLETLEKYFDTGFSEKMDKLELEYLISSSENDIRTFYSNFNKFIYKYIGCTTFLGKEAKAPAVAQVGKHSMVEETVEPEKTQNVEAIAVNKIDSTNNDTNGDNNILLISKLKNKVFLPYRIKDLTSILSRSRKYRDLQEIINDRFTVPIDRFRNPTISRFKEAYNLMRKKERASIMDSIDLALDVAFNSKLYPAVITACRNLEELDTYLDYLELNELDKFEFFKVKYEFYPTAN